MLQWCGASGSSASSGFPRILGQRRSPQGASSKGPYLHLANEGSDAEAASAGGVSSPVVRDGGAGLGLGAADGSGASPRLGVRTHFQWNNRHCSGDAIHEAVLNGDAASVKRLLTEDPSQATKRFTYSTVFQDQSQSGSGLPMHLAASRGHLEVVKLLQSFGAPLDSYVTRGTKEHYDVLHSAAFAEGKLDNSDVLRYLLQQGVPVKPNSDGQSVLHVAFRMGRLSHIKLLRKYMHERGMLHEVEGHGSAPQTYFRGLPPPLLLGIEMGRMTERQLAKAAAHTPASMHLFIEHEPRCIPYFVADIRDRKEVNASSMSAHLTGRDLAKVIEEWPAAACALLEGVLEMPVCEGQGWHSLPSRVSFAPRNTLERVRYWLNPEREVLAFYEPDVTWRFNVATFEAPPWHAKLNVSAGKPIRDCKIQVCHVPDLIGAELFSALGACTSSEHDDVFRNPVVNGCIEHTWWQGACRVDIMQVILSLWGLVLLILESYLLHLAREADHEVAVDARQLRPHAGNLLPPGSWQHTSDAKFTPGALVEISVAADFIGAKGVVDFFHELLQFMGYLCLGQGFKYVNLGNAWDLFRAAALMTLFFWRTSQTLRVLVIFICWMRLLDVFTSAEKIAAALLPIKRSAKGLLPVMLVTLVSFCAFMHAFHLVWGESKDFSKVVFKSFATLITTELPAHPLSKSLLELVLTYGAVIFFSIFILNIFIGVISQQYEQEKERVQVTLKHERAQCCLNFLLRARVLPCSFCGRIAAAYLTYACALIMLLTQTVGLSYEMNLGDVQAVNTPRPSPMLPRGLFAILQFMMLLAQYQNPEAAWALSSKAGAGAAKRAPDLEAGPQAADSAHRYLWLALPLDEDDAGREPISRSSTQAPLTFHENW